MAGRMTEKDLTTIRRDDAACGATISEQRDGKAVVQRRMLLREVDRLRTRNQKLVEHLRSFGKHCDDFGWHNLADEVRAVIEENDDGK